MAQPAAYRLSEVQSGPAMKTEAEIRARLQRMEHWKEVATEQFGVHAALDSFQPGINTLKWVLGESECECQSMALPILQNSLDGVIKWVLGETESQLLTHRVPSTDH